DRALRDQRADLLVAAERAAFHALDGEFGIGLGDAAARGAGGDEVAALQEIDMRAGEGDEIVLLLVMRDEGDTQGGLALNRFNQLACGYSQAAAAREAKLAFRPPVSGRPAGT